jgi:NitT/TauT family transport system ATP-binding protein
MAGEGIYPLPEGHLNWVFGLLEVLKNHGGREDGYKIARDLNFKFDDLLRVMKIAEILNFVTTPDGDVVLEPLGERFIESDVNQRKHLIGEQLRRHGLFNYFIRLLRAQPDHSLSKEVVLEHLAILLPNEKPEKMFATMVNWGRFAQLFGYSKDDDSFYLDQDPDQP